MYQGKKINMYCGGTQEYLQGVIHELLARGDIDFCYTELQPYTNAQMPPEDERIITYNPNYEVDCRYDLICDINELPPLDKCLMEKMLPYESMAIKLGWRNARLPVHDYETEKRNYYLHLRYWSHVIKKYNINFIYLREIPHSQAKWVIYGLAKVYDIPMCICSATSIDGRYVHGTSIGKMGISIQEKYLELCEKNIDEELTDPKIKAYYELHSQELKSVKKHMNPGKDQKSIDEQKEVKKMYVGDVIGWKGIKKYPMTLERTFRKSLTRTHSLKKYQEEKLYLRHLKRQMASIKFYRRNCECTLRNYNKMAVEPDYSKRYIYFGLQLTPEATTMPSAGVFAEQYNSVQLLAKVAEAFNIMVYVKEHYVQPSRCKDFYEDLLSIKNVRLIRTNVSTYDLMENSIAVSTQNGTCILEGALMGKPVVVIGDSFKWKGMPGVYEIDGYEQGLYIIERAISQPNVDKKSLKRYFRAIELETISDATNAENISWNSGGEKLRTIDKSKTLVSDKINIIEKYINM